jgi:hypothetical protein
MDQAMAAPLSRENLKSRPANEAGQATGQPNCPVSRGTEPDASLFENGVIAAVPVDH